MKRFPLDSLARTQRAGVAPYLEFLRSDSMSGGLYVLPAGGEDHQSPHAEDEIYLVLAGRSKFKAGGEEIDVAPGDAIFVPAREEHQFHDIAEELRLIVVFAPPEATSAS